MRRLVALLLHAGYVEAMAHIASLPGPVRPVPPVQRPWGGWP